MLPRRLLTPTRSRLARSLSTTPVWTDSSVVGGARAQLVGDSGDKEHVAREKRDFAKIDSLLRQVGRAQTEPSQRSGIPMHSSAPWSGVTSEQHPWSFTFDQSTRSSSRLTDRGKIVAVPEQPNGPSARASTSSAVEAGKAVELIPRKMHESYVEVELPVLSDPELLAEYVSTAGGLRIGKLVEHLDSLAGAIAYKHALPPPTNPPSSEPASLYLATAGADRLDLLRPLVVQDLRLSGQVCFVGSSSMEVFVKMEGLKEDGSGVRETLLLGRFTMVARDAQTHKARKVNPLLIESEAEQELFDVGKAHKSRKQEMSKMALSKVPPTADESAVLHELMLDHSTKRVEEEGKVIERVDMSETVTSADFLMHPQERNLHGQVFGGYLMRLAYELSYSNSVLFARSPMSFQSLDELSFQLPVPIGSVLRLTTTVTHTSTTTNQVHSHVVADVIDVSTGKRNKTNDFHFTWLKLNGNGLSREVKPVTYAESMAWLEGRRRLAVGNKMRCGSP